MKESRKIIRLNLNRSGSKHLDYVIISQPQGSGKRARKRALMWVNENSKTYRTNFVFVRDIATFMKNVIREDEALRSRLVANFVCTAERSRLEDALINYVKEVGEESLDLIRSLGVDMLLFKLIKTYLTEEDLRELLGLSGSGGKAHGRGSKGRGDSKTQKAAQGTN